MTQAVSSTHKNNDKSQAQPEGQTSTGSEALEVTSDGLLVAGRLRQAAGAEPPPVQRAIDSLQRLPDQKARQAALRRMGRYGNAYVTRVAEGYQATQSVSSPLVNPLQRVAACPDPPSVKPPTPPEQDPNFKANEAKTKQAAGNEKKHDAAKAKVAEAQAAAAGPPNEVASQAAAGQVDKMGRQKPGVFDKAAFIEAVKKAVAAIAPKTVGEADEFKRSGRAAGVRDQVIGIATSNKETATKSIKETTQASPDGSNAAPKPVTPMSDETVNPAPAQVDAAKGMPRPVSNEQVSLDSTKCQLDNRLEEADVTEEQIKKSNEPKFQQSLDAKKQAEADAATAPQKFRGEEQATLDKTHNEANVQSTKALGEMHAHRGGALAKLSGSKGETKAQDETKRAEIAAELEKIYNETKASVTQILDKLDGKVEKAFDEGEKSARASMENYIDTEVTEYKIKRYAGNPLLFLKDVAMKDTEVDKIIQKGGDLYFHKMEQVISNIADTVSNDLNAAKKLTEEGRNKIKQKVDSLPKNLQSIGQQAAQQIQGQFDQLDQEVNFKQEALVQSLAQKYSEASQQVNERLQELKDKNKGFKEQAEELLGETIQTILKFKAMLEGILAKAAGAIGKIIKDPIGFLGNLVSAVKMGLDRFMGNIGKHLKKGLMGWLLGQVDATGVDVPKSFDFQSILMLVLQILGLTFAQLRAKVMARLGPKGEQIIGLIEKGYQFFQLIKNGGIAALIEFFMTKLADLKETIVGQIWSMVLDGVIEAGVKWIIGLLNPASAFVKACMMIVDVVKFFIERGSQIMALVNAVLDSINAIADGALDGAAALVENALSKAMPVAISFLASLVGLGDIGSRVKGIIDNLQKKVGKVVDSLLDKAINYGKKLWAKAKGFGATAWGKIKGFGKKAFDKLFGKKKEKTEPQKQKDLEKGVNKGVSVVNKLKGKMIGESLIKSVLFPVKLYYKLAVLEPIKNEKVWAVHGEINRMTVDTRQQLEQEENEIVHLNIKRKGFSDRVKKLIKVLFPDQHKSGKGYSLLDKTTHRRHIISYNELAKHYRWYLNDQTVKKAKALLATKGESVKGSSNKDVQQAVINLLKKFDEEASNVWIGDAKENSTIKDKKYDFPKAQETLKKLNLETAKLKLDFIKRIKEKYFFFTT